MGVRSLALVGAAGGVGTTRLSVEAGAGLAADGRDVLVVDASLATQGMSAYVSGRIEPDLTAVLVGDASLDEAVSEQEIDTPGRLLLCPAHAPFTRMAAAQEVEAARGIETILQEANDLVDHTVIDVPPVAANVAIGAVTAADRVAVVTTPTNRGRDALSRCRGRLADLGVEPDVVVGNFVDDTEFEAGAVTVPVSRETDVPRAPTVLRGDDGFGPGVQSLIEAGFETSLSVSLAASFLDSARDYLS